MKLTFFVVLFGLSEKSISLWRRKKGFHSKEPMFKTGQETLYLVIHTATFPLFFIAGLGILVPIYFVTLLLVFNIVRSF